MHKVIKLTPMSSWLERFWMAAAIEGGYGLDVGGVR